ncbi:vWA domain-containing protein [Mycobacterium sp. ITM-2016-00316]|uniref:vWA domain-containing protein n=1 Tax=Mycobacterium sp. ITM-2016-00316 TaxID=2099695 RepID=UPI000CF90CEE|nr:vWA domain-containing protein [Mycobacterium sp. ITM-2016-00316]WNG83743.1 vWA domain-containing protein [Mycobacterium sp. ITM-2016-00316]
MPNQNLTLIAFLLDRSGSMQSIKSDVVGGFDAFLTEQRAGDGECRVTLAQFDSEYEVVYHAVPVGEVPALELNPRNSTALLDSMGKLITDTAAEINALAEDERPGSVVVAIMTDGMENSSREWSRPAIKSLVEQQTNQFGWEFLYMGADQDAVEVGKDLGVRAEQAVTYGRGKSREAMAAMSGNVRGYRTAKLVDAEAAMPAFSEDQRSDLAEG